MIGYYKNLSPRERYLIGATVLLILVTAAYILLFEPYYKKLAQLQTQVPEKQATYLWMNQEISQVNPELLKNATNLPNGSKGEDLPLVSIVEQSAKEANFKQFIKRMQPDKDGGIKIWLSDVYFDPWVQWIDQLSTQEIYLESVSITRGENALTNIQMVIKR